MVLLAVRENHPIVVTDPRDRNTFIETYVNPVLSAFDQVEAFEETLTGSSRVTAVTRARRDS
jgi:hypothetical protein